MKIECTGKLEDIQALFNTIIDKVITVAEKQQRNVHNPVNGSNPYPKMMYVSDMPITEENKGLKRCVFMEKGNEFIAWVNATSPEEAEKAVRTTPWKYAKDI